LDFSTELIQHADIVSVNATLVNYCRIVHTDKCSGHNALYYVRNTTINKMKTRCKNVFLLFFLSFLKSGIKWPYLTSLVQLR